jgi:hypothetical protein
MSYIIFLNVAPAPLIVKKEVFKPGMGVYRVLRNVVVYCDSFSRSIWQRSLQSLEDINDFELEYIKL